jgi:hypothetical protein
VVPSRTVRLAAPRKTCNIEQDELAKTRYTCLCTIVEQLTGDDNLVMPTFNFLQKERSKIGARMSIGGDSEKFTEESSIVGLPDDFKIAFLNKRSDLTGDDIVGMIKVDSSAINDLLVSAVQLPKKMKLPKEFLVKALLLEFLEARDDVCGGRLRHFKHVGGIGVDGGPRFKDKCGSYSCVLNGEKFIVKVRHWSGDEADVDVKSGLSSAWRVQDNFDDFVACLVMGNLRPVPLCSFFDKKAKTGPYKIQNFVGRPAELAAEASRLHTIYMASRAAATKRLSVTQEVGNAISHHKKQVAQAHMSTARESAKDAMKKKKLRRNESLK